MEHPIGIFDSGIGGLSVYLKCKKLLPNENFLYLDDGAYAPYGDKTNDYIIERTLKNVAYLKDCGAKAVVIACNTATTVAIKEARKVFGSMIIGTEPAVLPALKETSGRLLVLATPATCAALSARYQDKRIVFSPQPTLARDIERANGNDALRALAESVIGGDYEGIVLGCTHYSFLSPYINKKVFDGADGVARRLATLLNSSS